VVKGLSNREEVAQIAQLGIDGVIISNHGGRQLDAAESSIASLQEIVKSNDYKNMTIMMDSGIRTGTDVANVLACGAQFTFLGRSFMYGVAALGNHGGDQAINILTKELLQLMEQVGCSTIAELSNHRIHKI
jgi:L-lactate dehydrogenase (cytochrome)